LESGPSDISPERLKIGQKLWRSPGLLSNEPEAFRDF
jgi:hypothetical protein